MRLARFIQGDRPIAILDQGLLAVSRFVLLVAFARILPKEDFGAVGLAVTLSYLAIGFCRAVVAIPFVVSSATPDLIRYNAPRWFLLNLLVSGALSLLLLAAAAILIGFDGQKWIGSAVLWSAVLCPCAMIYEFIRRWMIQIANTRINLAQVAVFNLTTICGLVAFVLSPGIGVAMISLIVPYVAGIVMGLRGAAKSPWSGIAVRQLLELLRNSRPVSRWTLAEFAADAAQGYGMAIVVAALLGPLGTAGYVATRNLVAPIYSTVSALDTVELPRFARRLTQGGADSLRDAFRTSLLVHGAVSLICGAILAWLGGELLIWLYGSAYDQYRSALMIWAATAVVFATAKPFATWLLATGRQHLVFYAKLIGALITLVLIPALIPAFGLAGALLSAFTGVVASAAGAVVWYFRHRNSVPPPSSPD